MWLNVCYLESVIVLLLQAMKTYHAYQSDSKSAEAKLNAVETQKAKLEQQLAGKNLTSNRKLKAFYRQTEKVFIQQYGL